MTNIYYLNKFLYTMLGFGLLIKGGYIAIVGILVLIYSLLKLREYKFMYIFFLLLLSWQIIGYVKFNSYTSSNIDFFREIGFLDFKYLAILGIALFSITNFLLFVNGVEFIEKKLIKLSWYSVLIMLFIPMIENGPTAILNLYGYAHLENSIMTSYSFDTIAGEIGIILTLSILSFKNKIKFQKQLILCFIVSIILGRRSLSLLPIIFFIIYSSVYKERINFYKLFKSLLLVTIILAVLFHFSSFIDLDSRNSISRILKSFVSNEDDARVGLFEDFNERYAGGYFGMDYLPHEFNREGNSSFHNVIFDTLWYSGIVGLILYYIPYLILILRSVIIKDYKVLAIILVITAYQITGASPFGGFQQLCIIFPILMHKLKLYKWDIRK